MKQKNNRGVEQKTKRPFRMKHVRAYRWSRRRGAPQTRWQRRECQVLVRVSLEQEGGHRGEEGGGGYVVRDKRLIHRRCEEKARKRLDSAKLGWLLPHAP